MEDRVPLRHPIARLIVLSCLSASLVACGGGSGGDGAPGAVSAEGPLDEPAGIASPDEGASGRIEEDGEGTVPVEVDGAGVADFEPSMRTILRDLPVSGSQYVAHQNPIDTAGGAVYIANVEPGPDGDGPGIYVETRVRRGVPGADGGWSWSATPVERRTAYDRWHTPPAVGVDRDGVVHVAYNMHNFPWQYGVFPEPDSIDGRIRFLGEAITDEELALHVEQNRTRFDGPGEAAVPGNQITYPVFFHDRQGGLYLSSRQAARPARQFEERTFSSGIARHDADTGAWSPLGAPLPLEPGDVVTPDGSLPAPVVVAGRLGWTAYPPQLEFDADGRLHALLFWREGIAGRTLERPCVLVRGAPDGWRFADGTPATLPVGPDDCAPTGTDRLGDPGEYLSVADTAMDSRGRMHVVLSPEAGERYIAVLEDGRWERFPSPDRAGEIFFDAEDGLWALADGPVAWRRPAGTEEFVPVTIAPSDDQCYPRAAVSDDGRRAYVHARGCTDDLLNVYEIELLPRG